MCRRVTVIDACPRPLWREIYLNTGGLPNLNQQPLWVDFHIHLCSSSTRRSRIPKPSPHHFYPLPSSPLLSSFQPPPSHLPLLCSSYLCIITLLLPSLLNIMFSSSFHPYSPLLSSPFPPSSFTFTFTAPSLTSFTLVNIFLPSFLQSSSFSFLLSSLSYALTKSSVLLYFFFLISSISFPFSSPSLSLTFSFFYLFLICLQLSNPCGNSLFCFVSLMYTSHIILLFAVSLSPSCMLFVLILIL